MAKATAICRCERCGKEFKKVAVKRNSREAEDWEAWAAENYTMCDDCIEAERQERAVELAEEARNDGLPELVGSEKQITWAEQIRKAAIDDMDKELEKARKSLDQIKDADTKAKNTQLYKEFETTVAYVSTKESAGWWIDHRNYSGFSFIRDFRQEALMAEAEKAAQEAPEPEAEDDAVVVPEEATQGTAEVVVEDNTVKAYYPKDDTFMSIVKDAGYKWDRCCWAKEITQYTGSAVDRAADLANRLLRSGFSVKCTDADVRAKAVSGDFELECTRWIKAFTAGQYEGWLSVSIPSKYADKDSQRLYDAARRIKGSKWTNGCVAVPVAQYDEAKDFADIYGYRFSASADKAVDEFRSRTTVKVAAPEQAEKKDVLKDILASDDAVLADLEDD